MIDHEVDIRLVGFAGFEASERFLQALYDEIWVARWGLPPRPRVHRPTELTTAEMMRHELELPCKVVVISAHVGYDESERICFFSESGPKPILCVDELGKLGATSMVLVDGCSFEILYPHLKIHTQPGVRMVGLKGGVRKWTQGRDSVAVVAAVIRELCYATKCGLSLEAVDRAVELVNAQIVARNEYISGKVARMPSLDVQQALRPDARLNPLLGSPSSCRPLSVNAVIAVHCRQGSAVLLPVLTASDLSCQRLPAMEHAKIA